MNNNSRTKNALMNTIFNFLHQALMIFLAFFSRRVFIENLGMEYLGVSGLFNNILGILSFTELGISGAINFSLYKLLAEKDEEKIKGIISYYKKLYNRIAIIIFVLGVALIPFLDYIVKLDNNIPHLKLYYFVQLLSTVSSYLFVYKTSIVTADQKSYKFKGITIAISVITTFVQCISLICYKNYLIYIIVGVIFGLLSNIICSQLAQKWYPYINEKVDLSTVDKKNIWSNIKDMFIYKMAGIIINNTDNLLISVMINTINVGLYSNYTMLINKLNAIISLTFNSLTASIGNLNAIQDRKKQYEFFNILLFVTFCLMYISTIGLFFVGEDLIITFLQKREYLFSTSLFLIIVINYYSSGINYPIWTYRSTTGLFKMAKIAVAISVFINIIFSIVLGHFFGIAGIIGATLIARLCTTIWYEPYILYKKIFMVSPKEYFYKQIIYIMILIISILVIKPIIDVISIGNLYINIIVKMIICLAVSLVVIFLIFFKSNEFKYLINKFKDFKIIVLHTNK